jgi:hypothetical protein
LVIALVGVGDGGGRRANITVPRYAPACPGTGAPCPGTGALCPGTRPGTTRLKKYLAGKKVGAPTFPHLPEILLWWANFEVKGVTTDQFTFNIVKP